MTTASGAPRLSVIIATHDNQPILARCLEAWRRFASRQSVEILVIEDGCTDGTGEYLCHIQTEPWGDLEIHVLHEENVHELMCTNRGFREARAPLIMSWHDDMFLESRWFVPELLATFERYPEIGLLSLSRGLQCAPVADPVQTFEDSIDWRRLESTIGSAPLNWVQLTEVDAVVRPWVVRRACLDRVGLLDEAFRPTEWDEADLCFRIRGAGWRVATHGYERDGAYEHLLSSTLGRTNWEQRQATALRNAVLFHERWDVVIAREHTRRRRTWRRRLGAAAAAGSVRALFREGRRRLRRRATA